ncbi:MAG: hypothetical protein GY873_40695 [Bosea sp.]|jgi:hypothetical protein|uniref:hypothetical protein n=1 Tax=Hyphomicrobiales TaxID=356 RepID=UPI000830EEFA|nr:MULTISPECIES: hypothetical protein [Hyphomicrobiales]MCP4561783.1 hypothetical protein [Bosea sp. (in: a-proteobacteria)]MCP4740522.1 hypothetical protein [Bosea sp. (in: a-proteobacteria)]MDX3805945.1 hypothetical protein [Bosea sp. (in: a-proteobacteria)]
MNWVLRPFLIVGSLLAFAPAFAAIPTNDARQLDQKAATSGTTIKLVPITTQRKSANDGVKCAVTTGKKAEVKDPATKAQAGSGAKTIQAYSPTMPATPAADAKGSTLASQNHFKTTGDVVGGLEASRTSLESAQSAFRSAGQEVGTATTVMAALDMNSAARIQNGLAWTGATNATNLWVTAINALNLARTSDRSRGASGLRMGGGPGSDGSTCPQGMIGNGTIADPCRSASTCSTTPLGTTPDPACASARIIDSSENVLFYLTQMQQQNATGAAAGSVALSATGSVGSSLSTTDVAAALEAAASSNR